MPTMTCAGRFPPGGREIPPAGCPAARAVGPEVPPSALRLPSRSVWKRGRGHYAVQKSVQPLPRGVFLGLRDVGKAARSQEVREQPASVLGAVGVYFIEFGSWPLLVILVSECRSGHGMSFGYLTR